MSFFVDLHRQFQVLPTWFSSGIFTFSNFWTKIRKCQKTYFWAALEASKLASPWEGDASGPILSATAPTATPIVRKTSPNLDFWAKVGLRLRPGSSIFLYLFVCCVLLYFLYVFCIFFCVFKHFFGTASLWRCLRRQKVDEKVCFFEKIYFLINKHFLLLKVSEKTARSWKANNKYHRPVVFTTRWYFLI